MADLTRTVAVLFNAENNVSKEIDKISDDLDAAGKGMQDFGEPFVNATKQVMALNAAIAGIAIAGVKASSDIETQTKRMTASLGLPAEEAEKFAGIAKEVYSAGFGEELVDTFDAVTLAQKRFGDNAEVDVGKVVKQAMKISSVFGVDIDQSMAAAKTLMENFGLSSEEAFGFVAKGFQEGLDNAGDFTETINEYSTQFANGEMSAAEFFSVIKTGFSEGMLGTDKAADAFKEFRVRIQDGSKLTAESLASIGIDNEALQENLNSGKVTVADAFNLVIQKLNETTDASTVMQAGVGLIGTQFEDLGTDAVLSIDTTIVKLEDFKKSLLAVDPESFEVKMVSAWRTVSSSFGDLEMWEAAKEKISNLFTDIAEVAPEALNNVDFSGLMGSVNELWGALGDVLANNDFDLTTLEGLENAIQFVVDSFQSVVDVTEGIVTTFSPIVGIIVDVVEEFNGLSSETKTGLGYILGIGTAIGAIGGGVSAVSGVVKSFGVLSSVAIGLPGKIAPAISSVKGLSAAFYASPAAMVVAAGAIGVYTGNILRDLFPVLDEAAYKIIEFSDKLFNWTGTQAPEMDIDTAKALAKIAETERAIAKLDKEIAESDRQLEILAKIEADPFSGEDFAEQIGPVSLQAQIDHEELTAELAESGVLVLATDVDPTGAIEAVEVVMEQVGEKADGSPIMMVVDADASKASEKLKEIDEAVPTEKQIEIQLQGDIDERLAIIKGEFELMQSEVEWQAKLDIAEAEASAKVMEAAFASINVGIESTGGLIASLFESMGDGASQLDQWDIERQIEKENELRKQSFDLQKKLTESQIEYNEAKTKALQDGDVSLTVHAEGLTPALEMIFHEILKMAQLEANAEGVEMILGG
ncbi:phage tail tape measure protein [Desulfoluna spongiiphila]|uniref:Phage-related minor tail protein n=1 Tax=Desulfoluna spongiiphila TaxID=419481 RepID=A0A1G5FZW3_9BACT|nr:phage tail tape measure protein [Desulfoluna spongiiphila]SCY44679.1 Phage-related minor tail protein [Desulfoluna spongiiphila]